MGCTSSTSNIPEVQTKSTDKTIHFLEDSDIYNVQNEDGGINKSKQEFKKDVVNDVQQLEHNNSFVSKDPINNENKRETQERVNYNTDGNDEQTPQENTSSFKEIAEHVISINVEKQENLKINSSNTSLNPLVNYETETNLEKSTQEIEAITRDEVHREEVHESGSPSQSECSRATRWEALADMAAELPPSLTVDLITGQIYALSK